METGVETRLGTAVILPALDGTIYEFTEKRGVPQFTFDFNESATDYWARHWANPASSTYVSSANVRTHTHEVVVAPGNLNSALSLEPPNTTFRLQAGVHGGHGPGNEILIEQRTGTHIISDDTGSRATIRSLRALGTTASNKLRGTDGFPAMLKDRNNTSLHAEFNNMPRDLIIKDINFVAEPGSIAYDRWELNTPLTTYSKGDLEGIPIILWSYQDILVQNCTFTGYEMQDAANGQFDTPTIIGAPSGHPGLITGGRGLNNITARDCTFNGSPNDARGFPAAIYWDGVFGGVMYNCTTTQRWHFSHLANFVNDDVSGDYDYDGRWLASEIRNSKFMHVINNTFNKSNNSVQLMAERSLIKGNTWTWEGGGNYIRVVLLSTKPSQWYQLGVYYRDWYNVIDGNTVNASCTAFVEQESDPGWNNNPINDQNSPYRGRVGKATVTNNHVTGTVGSWLRDLTSTIVPSDEPNVQSGNITP
jgi:hypothetical protein